MDYIFTEYFVDSLNNYNNVVIYIDGLFLAVLGFIGSVLPYLVKYLIGYCHFYYQLGYGLIFYIYIYRRNKAKKNNNWRTFYGNSVTNWVLFYASIFNKFVFNRNFGIFFKAKLIKSIKIIAFWTTNIINSSNYLVKFINTSKYFYSNIVLYSWTPIFKRSSYIAFLTFLKRFTKRK